MTAPPPRVDLALPSVLTSAKACAWIVVGVGALAAFFSGDISGIVTYLVITAGVYVWLRPWHRRAALLESMDFPVGLVDLLAAPRTVISRTEQQELDSIEEKLLAGLSRDEVVRFGRLVQMLDRDGADND